MAKRKVKIKKGSKVNELYTNSPEYRQLYNSGTLASIDEEGLPNMYYPEVEVTAKRDRVADAVRKGRGKIGAGVLSALDYAMQFGDTPMALGLEFLTGRGDYNAALPNITRSLKKFNLPVDESLKPYQTKNDQLTVSEALGVTNPYLSVPIDILSSRGIRGKSAKAVKNPKKVLDDISINKLPANLQSSNQAGFLNLNTLTDKEKEMYEFFLEEERFNKLPNTINKNALEVLNNFKTRIQTPEGQERLKKLGITEEQLLHDLSIIDDSNTYGYYRPSRNKIAINPLDPLINNTTRHEIEHGVQNAFKNSNPNNEGITDIDNLLSGLQLRKEGTLDKTWGKNQTDKAVDVSQYKSLLGEKQRATDYFLTGSKGAEKSAFLAEVQQYMMDQGVIPKTSYKEVTPEMVKNTFTDAMFDEDGGKYLRLFNIMKANDNNYNLVSEGLNKMLGLAPAAIATGAALSQLPQEEKALGGKITNDMRKKKNKKLPIDNQLPKAYLGAILSGLPQLAGAGAGAMTGATAGMASGAGGGLSGLGAGASTMGNVGGGTMTSGATMTGGSTMDVNNQTQNSLSQVMKGLSGPLGPLASATTKAVAEMINSFITPEKNYRTTLKNTGAHYATGGEIKIKPSKRGTFTKAAKQRGMGVQQFASKVLANKDNYSPAMVKKANFARNAAKWKKAMGGLVEPEIFEMGGLTGTYMDAFDAMGYGGNVYNHPDYSDYMALGGMTGVDPTKPPMYSWSTGSVPALGSKIQNTQSSSISKTIPSAVNNVMYEGRTFPEVEINAQRNISPENTLSNSIDTFTNAYKNKPLGKDAFPWKYTDETMIDDGYGYGHNNMWMSNDIGLDNYKKSNKENKATVTGHIDDIMNNYDERKNENPSLYLIKKNLNLPNQKKYSGQTSEQGLYQGDYFENEKNYINKNIRSKGYTYQDISGDNNLIQSFTPEQDTLLGSVTLTPEMWKDIYSSKSDKEAKQKLFKMANVSPEEQKNFDNTFIHMNLNNPKQLNTYKKAKSKLPNTNWDANRSKPSMALGGIMGGGDPTLPPLKATSQDSANVVRAYQGAMNLGKYYADKGYKKKDEAKLPYAESNMFKNELDKLYSNFLTASQTTYPSASGKAVKGKLDPAQYRKPADPTKPYTIEQREVAKDILDTRAPFGYYDTRIVPQSITSYENVNPNDPLYGDVATVPTYDISTKPYAMRTPEEQAEVERKYGKPIPVVEPKRIIPVTDLRRDSKDYLRTLENLDDKNTFIEYLRSGVDANEVRNLAPIEIQRRANAWKRGMAYGGMVDPLMAFGGMIDPTMAMQQMMYGSYAQGGQVPQNIPVEVEGEEMYEMPNGETGEFSGPKHENGGIPIALPEGTKIYSDRLKVNGKTMAQRKDKREANINKLEKLLTKNPNDKFIKEALKRQQETAALEEQGDMATQEQANQEQQMQEMAMEEMLMGAAMQDMQQGMMAMGGMIKRADGSYSQRGLWDNIRANRGSGKKPTKEMLAQEKKIRAAEKAYGGMIKYADGGKIPQNILRSRLESHMSSQEADSYLNKYQGGTGDSGIPPYNPYGLMTNQFFGQPTIQAPNNNPLMMNDKDYLNYLNSQNPNRDLDVTLMPPSEQTYEPTLNYNVETFTGMPSSVYNVSTPNTTKATTPATKTKTGTEDEKDFTYTEGDRTGMAGTAVGMYGPTLMTLLNRLETPPNQNFFNTYGQDALRTQMEAEGIAGQSKDEAYRKNIMRANALRNAIANSARGVGDMRTQQLTAALTEQEGARDILGSYLQSMAGLKGQRANLQAQIDQTRMGGEYQRDLADRQDVDQFYTNLAQNITGVSEGMQKMGRDKNIAKRNKDILSLSKYYSSYGIYADYDDRGNLVLKDQSTGKVKSDKEIEKLKEEIEKLKKEKGKG